MTAETPEARVEADPSARGALGQWHQVAGQTAPADGRGAGRLGTTVEELNVASEPLRQQNIELIAGADAVQSERQRH